MISKCQWNEAFQFQAFYTGTLLTHDYDVSCHVREAVDSESPINFGLKIPVHTWKFSGGSGLTEVHVIAPV